MIVKDLEWKSCNYEKPPLDLEVMTKIHDGHGCRNETTLKLCQRTPVSRSMWFLPDMSMYVYYTPTHWAYILKK